ncbi:hypothetical protein SAMN06297144_0827 [Sphingomonas guangdongensis]|uniref:Dolichyl-phosphate-mannose-protein mannosyltransferase n=1 Tax=Sphingomonas guangdongensis TaxID=1141890 RepID=A0A285QDQ9_9SPHN|nr:hypothetical protein SAMN06297144_0827 [Sphingomonas guangdongensis]
MSEAARPGRVAGLILVLVWLSCAWFGSWEWNANNATRLFAAITIAEDGSARIDRFAPLTIDKAQFGDHFYSDKAPGTTLMALPAVWAAEATSGMRSADLSFSPYDPAADRFLRLRLKLATMTGAALLTAAAAVLLFDLGTALGGSAAAGVFASLGFALGSPMWGWSTTLFGHAPVAALFVVAIWAVWRGTEGTESRVGLAAVAGAALGWAVVIEYPAAIGGAVIGGWALVRLWRFPPPVRARAIGAAVAPALLAGAVLLGYNWLAHGAPFRLGYQGVVGWDGMRQGLFGLTYPRPDVLWEVTLGTRRGLVWVAPVMLTALVGIARLIRAPATRDVGVMALAGAVAAIAYNAAYVYWDGGNSTGARHAVPALAFLAVGLAPAWQAFRATEWRVLTVALLTLSIAVNLVIAAAEVTSGGTGAFPLWSDVIVGRFAGGYLRTLPNEWWGWSAWSGLGLYLLIAGGLLVTLLRTLQSIDAGGNGQVGARARHGAGHVEQPVEG